MTHIALLGAGFSRNWGGWLAPEVFGELLSRLGHDRETYQRLRRSGNFEDTLAELQAEVRSQGSADANARLQNFELAVQSTFAEMNSVFAAFSGWGLSNDVADSIDAFLSRFDAIYTLNQDLLLELHYRIQPIGSRRWAGISYPGMQLPRNWQNLLPSEKLAEAWQPSDAVRTESNAQPIIKLHGSTNWRDPNGNRLMVMGGAKLQAIDRHPVLSEYLRLFTNQVCAGETKVMAIGYSFSDSHINDILRLAGREHGLRLHLVNPAGLSALRPPREGLIPDRNPLDEIPLMGITVRTLREAFSGEKLSQKSLMRFFE